jgi:hypothetical protein
LNGWNDLNCWNVCSWSESAVRLDFKNHAIHAGRGVAQCEDVPAKFAIRYLGCLTGKSFALGVYFDGGILEHVLAPVLSLHFARRCIKASLIIDEAKFDRPPLAGFASDGGQVGDHA